MSGGEVDGVKLVLETGKEFEFKGDITSTFDNKRRREVCKTLERKREYK